MMRLLPGVLCLAALVACGGAKPVSDPAPPGAASMPATPAETTATTPDTTSGDVPAPPTPPGPAEAAAAEPVVAAPPPPPAPAKPDPAQVKAELLAAEMTAWSAAKPVLEKHCASCHAKGGKAATKKKLSEFDITSYPVAGHHPTKTGEETREVLGLEGKKATMPFGKPGAVKGEELAAVKAWTEAWDQAQRAGAHAP